MTNLSPQTASFFQGGARLQLSQLLWDGRATSKEVERLGHARLLRWFEFVDSTEQTGLEAAKAWYDVVRYRRDAALAEENYVQHKFTLDQVKSRVNAGVGRGVDLEQVLARVALAESNLVTERANLHDVTERYLRIVGALPPAGDTDGGLVAGPLPATQAAAMEQASSQSPAVAAAVENLRSARSAAQGRRSAYQPRIEAQATTADGHNLDGQLYERRNSSAQIVLTWNLLNGGTDAARERQFARLLEQAADLRDKACNDTRQTEAIAFNDVRKLDEQLVYLERNVTSIQHARDAYRQQFDIGQRSLLDLLNAENELYTAKRADVEAEEDRAIAVARVHAGMGDLAHALGLRGADAAQAPEARGWVQGDDASARCPLEPIAIGGASRSELDRRAEALEVRRGAAPPALPASDAVPSAPAVVPVLPSSGAPRSAPALAPVAADATAGARQRVSAWAAAWSAKDADAYLAFYAPDFAPGRSSHADWMAERRRRLAKSGPVSVTVKGAQARQLADGRVETEFAQVYASSGFRDSTRKTLTWALRDGRWQIVGESDR
jgi:adhesin transport system outer membrane protein